MLYALDHQRRPARRRPLARGTSRRGDRRSSRDVRRTSSPIPDEPGLEERLRRARRLRRRIFARAGSAPSRISTSATTTSTPPSPSCRRFSMSAPERLTAKLDQLTGSRAARQALPEPRRGRPPRRRADLGEAPSAPPTSRRTSRRRPTRSTASARSRRRSRRRRSCSSATRASSTSRTRSTSTSRAPRTRPSIRRLLSHASGLQRETHDDSWLTLRFAPPDELLETLDRAEMVLPAGARFHYSNLAFALLGIVVERVSRRGVRGLRPRAPASSRSA